MRIAPISLCVGLTLLLVASSPAFADSPACGCDNASQNNASNNCDRASDAGCGSKNCSAKHGGHCGCKKRKYEGMARNFNCNCDGSYNYPVPPLYTYHWPGMYKQQRMTDYHSPWRFPAIKPYSDEPISSAENINLDMPEFLRPVAYEDSITLRDNPKQAESMSSKFEKLAR